MIFSSFPFLLLFLPLVLGVYALHVRHLLGANMLIRALIVASLAFYSAWDWRYLPVLLGSVLINYLAGRQLTATRRPAWLWAGIVFNLGLLGWFKYRLFLAEAVQALLLPDWLQDTYRLALPLGISFFTFQQIAWLVDLSRRDVAFPRFTEYLFFVTFFPQLIAGPIVHARELLPQIRGRWPPWRAATFASGLLMLSIGLAKKVLIADPLDAPVDSLFSQAASGSELGGETPWLAGFGYGVQLYFDFSGYADMAIGLALMLGLALPINFDSPYRSASLIDFWRRWHITLSTFLRDYLYLRLGGRRRLFTSLVVTMLLGGLWHGAGWQFLLWGALHGLALCFAHGWRRWGGVKLATWVSLPLTLSFVMLAWIPFRADSISTALPFYQALTSPWQLDAAFQWPWQSKMASGRHGELVMQIAIGMSIALYLPNSQQWMHRFRQLMVRGAQESHARGFLLTGLVCGGLLFAVFKALYGQPDQAFLYFEF